MTLPDSWQVQRLSDCLAVPPSYGANTPAVDFSPNLPRYLRITDISDEGSLIAQNPKCINDADAEGCFLEIGDLVFARTGATVGKSYLHCDIGQPLAYAGYLIRFRVNRSLLLPEFLFQFTHSPHYWEWVAVASRAGAQPNINASEFCSLRLLLPSVEEQKAIIIVLSTWDRGIRQLGDLIAAKLRSREGLIQRLLNGTLRFQEYSNRVHEQIPLNHVLEKISDSVIPSANEMYREIGVRSHGKGLFHKEPVSGESLGNKRVYRVVPGCLTVNIVFAWERAVAITTEREDGMIVSHRFPMFRPNPDRLLTEYALLYLLSKKGSEALELASPGGAGRNRTLSQTGLLKNLIPLPSVPEQRRVVTFVQTADREIGLLRKQLEALKQQKKGLMQKLLTGELRVKLPKGVV